MLYFVATQTVLTQEKLHPFLFEKIGFEPRLKFLG
jgi:hypothetical protein